MGKINVAELLRDCPSGMELDCTMFEGVEFDSIVDDNEYLPIRCRIKNSDGGYNIYNFTKHGYWIDDCKAKCVIFPKGKTSWEGFHRPFKDGDIIYIRDEYSDATFTYVAIFKQIENGGHIYSHCFYNYEDTEFSTDDYLYDVYRIRFATEEEKEKLFKAIKDNGYEWNPDTKTLEKLPVFKVGDKIKHKDDKTVITITGIKDNYYLIQFYNSNKNDYQNEKVSFKDQDKYELVPNKLVEPRFKVGDTITNGKTSITIGYIDNEYYYEISRNIANRLFIKNQDDWELVEPIFKVGDRIRSKKDAPINISNALITKVKSSGYEGVIGDTTNKAYINFKYQDNYELVPDKFDITSLKPFDQVLVRDFDNTPWEIEFFSRLLDGKHFKCLELSYVQCIPYKGNEHLNGKKDDCDKYFKTWE